MQIGWISFQISYLVTSFQQKSQSDSTQKPSIRAQKKKGKQEQHTYIVDGFSEGFELSRGVAYQFQYALPCILPEKKKKKMESINNSNCKYNNKLSRIFYYDWEMVTNNLRRWSGESLEVPMASTSRRKAATAVLTWNKAAATAWDSDWFLGLGLGRTTSWKLIFLLNYYEFKRQWVWILTMICNILIASYFWNYLPSSYSNNCPYLFSYLPLSLLPIKTIKQQ